MASPTRAVRTVRDARGEKAPPRTTHFQQYDPTDDNVCREMKTVGGDAGMKELREWMVTEVHRTGRSPKPDAVRKRFGRSPHNGDGPSQMTHQYEQEEPKRGY